jgi:hypothetical protein
MNVKEALKTYKDHIAAIKTISRKRKIEVIRQHHGSEEKISVAMSILMEKRICTECGSKMKETSPHSWRCQKKNCRLAQSGVRLNIG